MPITSKFNLNSCLIQVYRAIANPKSCVEIVCAEQVVGVYTRQAMITFLRWIKESMRALVPALPRFSDDVFQRRSKDVGCWCRELKSLSYQERISSSTPELVLIKLFLSRCLVDLHVSVTGEILIPPTPTIPWSSLPS
ncbi:hypothetical protein Bca4012_049326 [Brassica carinata]